MQKLNQLFAVDLTAMIVERRLDRLHSVVEQAMQPEAPTKTLLIEPKNFLSQLLLETIKRDWPEGMMAVMEQSLQHGHFIQNVDLAAQYGAQACLERSIAWLDALSADHCWWGTRSLFLDMAMEGAISQGHLRGVTFLLDSHAHSPVPWEFDLHCHSWLNRVGAIKTAVRQNHVGVVERMKQVDGFERHHVDLLAQAATHRESSPEMIDCLFDLEMAQHLVTHPDMCFDRKSTNVYFLDKYDAECSKRMLNQEIGEGPVGMRAGRKI